MNAVRNPEHRKAITALIMAMKALEEAKEEWEAFFPLLFLLYGALPESERTSEGESGYYGTDHLGSTTLIVDDEGNVLQDKETTPFGDQDDKDGVFFTGKLWDADAELYYFNARWYDADSGRFITEDPIRDGLLWYAYCNNNPMIFVDPFGLEIQEVYDGVFVDTETKEVVATPDGIVVGTPESGIGYNYYEVDMELFTDGETIEKFLDIFNYESDDPEGKHWKDLKDKLDDGTEESFFVFLKMLWEEGFMDREYLDNDEAKKSGKERWVCNDFDFKVLELLGKDKLDFFPNRGRIGEAVELFMKNLENLENKFSLNPYLGLNVAYFIYNGIKSNHTGFVFDYKNSKGEKVTAVIHNADMSDLNGRNGVNIVNKGSKSYGKDILYYADTTTYFYPVF